MYNFRDLKPSMTSELEDIVKVHSLVVLDYFHDNQQLREFYSILNKMHQFKMKEDKYDRLKVNAVEENQLANVKKEKLTEFDNKL